MTNGIFNGKVVYNPTSFYEANKYKYTIADD
jgi:hypothetical protein